MENKEKISAFVKIAAIAIMVIFFLPTICVSCDAGVAKVEVEFSAFDAAIGGVDEKVYDEIRTEQDSEDDEIAAEPILFIIVVLALIIFKVTNNRPVISIICAAGCGIMMLLMKRGVKDWIIDNGGEFGYSFDIETTFFYFIHMVLCAGIIGLLLFEKFVLEDPERKKQFAGMVKGIQKDVKNSDTYTISKDTVEEEAPMQSKPVSPDANKVIVRRKSETAGNAPVWICACGAKNSHTAKYCSACFKDRPHQIMEENTFVEKYAQMPTADLQLILEDQQELYSKEEIAIIKRILSKRNEQ